MPEKVLPGPIHGNPSVKEAVCIHTRKVYDSCKDKECLENLRVFLTREGQNILDRAINVKAKKAELIWVYIDIEPIQFNRGFFTVDVKFFYRIKADAFLNVGMPTEIEGVASFDKRVVLCGGEGAARIFSSAMELGNDKQLPTRTNLPIGVVEVVDPIILGVKVVDSCDHRCGSESCCEIPRQICECFSSELIRDGESNRLLVTLGQFSIIKLERDSQLLIPSFDFCMPEKDCSCGPDEEPCNIFDRMMFPVDEFFPR